jgi:hypothetical protein
MTEELPVVPATGGTIKAPLANFEAALLARIAQSGLPTLDVFVPVAQRAAVSNDVQTTLALLTPE